ncbi:hypothetical protein J4221_04805 [Candidatus Pacearchaeota archaeon]|nr:hypothetical protein [Candidatus Pacearchaeota archaeon]
MTLKQKLIAGTISGALGLVTLIGCELYDSRFSNADRLYHESHVDANTANRYDLTFNEDDVMFFGERKISPETANAYLETFNNSYNLDRSPNFGRKKYLPKDIASFVENNISPEDIVELIGEFSDLQISEYNQDFTFVDIYHLIKSNINPEEANKYALLNRDYNSNIRGIDIVKYKEKGFTFEEISKKARENWLEKSLDE